MCNVEKWSIVLTIIRAEQELKMCYRIQAIIKKACVCFYVSTDQINVYIDVLGPSLNPPSFSPDASYSYRVSEAAELNTTVAVVTADDPDPGM